MQCPVCVCAKNRALSLGHVAAPGQAVLYSVGCMAAISLPSLILWSLQYRCVSALVRMFCEKVPGALAPSAERPGWMQEPWSTLLHQLETWTSIGPKAWEAKDLEGVLKFCRESLQTPQICSKEWLIPAGHMVGCLLFAYKVAVEENAELDKQVNEMKK